MSIPATQTTRRVLAPERAADPGSVVPAGPFTDVPPPWELLRQISTLPDGSTRTGDEVRARSAAWLRAELDAAGVELGDYDQTVVDLLAEDCTTTVQVVAGWIARARSHAGAREPIINGDHVFVRRAVTE